MSCIPTTLTLLCLLQGPSTSTPLKKITIVGEAPKRLSRGFMSMTLPAKLDDPSITQLRDYVNGVSDLQKKPDPEIIFSTLAWVSKQWSHDGDHAAGTLTSYEILQHAKKGEQFRCVEYGKVTADVLQTFGYVSRQIFMQSADAAYGGYGCGHVTAEVFSNALDKWVWVDPQFGLYAKNGKNILNYLELYNLYKKSKFKDVEFVYAEPPKQTAAEHAKAIDDYQKFISRYFGQMSFEAKDGQLVLPLSSNGIALTFQSHPAPGLVQASGPEDVYFPLNHTLPIVYYNAEAWPKVEGSDSWDDATFKKRMGEVAAKPDLKIYLLNNMPWFDHYEVRVNGAEWQTVKEKFFPIKLPDGDTTFEAVGVNSAGLRGVPATLRLRYR